MSSIFIPLNLFVAFLFPLTILEDLIICVFTISFPSLSFVFAWTNFPSISSITTTVVISRLAPSPVSFIIDSISAEPDNLEVIPFAKFFNGSIFVSFNLSRNFNPDSILSFKEFSLSKKLSFSVLLNLLTSPDSVFNCSFLANILSITFLYLAYSSFADFKDSLVLVSSTSNFLITSDLTAFSLSVLPLMLSILSNFAISSIVGITSGSTKVCSAFTKSYSLSTIVGISCSSGGTKVLTV